MYSFASDPNELDPRELDELRTRLRKMSDAALRRFGEAARFLCRDKNPRRIFVVQLEEARTEWRRRHPNPSEVRSRFKVDTRPNKILFENQCRSRKTDCTNSPQ